MTTLNWVAVFLVAVWVPLAAWYAHDVRAERRRYRSRNQRG